MGMLLEFKLFELVIRVIKAIIPALLMTLVLLWFYLISISNRCNMTFLQQYFWVWLYTLFVSIFVMLVK